MLMTMQSDRAKQPDAEPKPDQDDGLKGRIAQRIGYDFADESLLKMALTHPSLAGGAHYQRLEFLGDRVLGLVISHWLYEKYPDEAEGQLNRRFTALVRRETLSDLAQKLDLGPMIRMEAGARSEGTAKASAVLADICEALIGAIYLDGGLDAARQMIHRFWADRVKAGPSAYRDAKTALQEWAQGRGLPLPVYQLLGRSGPDHSPVFQMRVEVRTAGKAEASGASKRSAEQLAATRLLDMLTGKDETP